jgi:CheY-like chemotaxis protein
LTCLERAMPTKILAIDDSKTMRLAIKITFAAEDAEVTAVSKGSEAIARAKQLGADVVLVDASLAAGEPSGYDVCEQLKADADTAKIPVLLLVSNQGGVDAARLKRCGADGFIAKPFETQELIDKVGELLGKLPRATAPAAAVVAPTAPVVAAVPPTAAVAAAPVVSPPVAAPVAPPVVAPPVAAAPARVAPVAAPGSGKTVPLVGAPNPGARPPAGPVAAAAPTSEARSTPTAAGPARLQPAVRPASTPIAVAADAAIPIAIPIPFAPASDPTPGILARLRAQGGATSGLDPKLAEAIVALSREVLEAVAWEIVPELAEQIVRAQAEAKAG